MFCFYACFEFFASSILMLSRTYMLGSALIVHTQKDWGLRRIDHLSFDTVRYRTQALPKRDPSVMRNGGMYLETMESGTYYEGPIHL